MRKENEQKTEVRVGGRGQEKITTEEHGKSRKIPFPKAKRSSNGAQELCGVIF
jgi:hypothetical protein